MSHRALIPAARSERARLVAGWFGLDLTGSSNVDATQIEPDQLEMLLPKPGHIVLITGPSGAGKSSLLRLLAAMVPGDRWIDLAEIEPAGDRPLVDCFGPATVEQVLSLLSRVGLSEAWTYLRTPAELSDGQRWRLRLAVALYGAADRSVVACDEFAALLDRVTAAVVARAVRRTMSAEAGRGIGAILVTSHDDLLRALKPDVHVYCDFGTVTVSRFNG